MIFLIVSIILSAGILLIFKAFTFFKVRMFLVIVINYWVCVATGLIASGAGINELISFIDKPWLPLTLLLGSSFIIGFNAINLTVKHIGVTAASVASKNAMVISATAAFFLYQDTVTWIKIAGILLAMAAIVLASIRKNGENGNHPFRLKDLFLPFVVFVVSGFIETLLKYIQHFHLDPSEYNFFLVFLFGMAGAVGTLMYFVQIGVKTVKKQKIYIPGYRDLLAGVVLGVPNYGTIYFLIKALEQPNWESSVVYPVNNIGIVLLSALLAFIIFKEKLSRLNLIGIAIAVIAIIMIAWDQLITWIK